jgi:transposase
VEKNLRRRVRRLRAANPGKGVEVWAEDEARLGLKPITRRVWWLKGCRPASSGRTKYEWLYVYGFARPKTGDTFAVLLPRVNVERMADALAAFAAHADPDGTRVLVLVVDNAGWHRAKRLPVPANVRLHFLPPCTPELQPVEPFWALVREAVANDTFDRLGDLRRVIRRRCRRLAEDRATVLGAIGFRWAVRMER